MGVTHVVFEESQSSIKSVSLLLIVELDSHDDLDAGIILIVILHVGPILKIELLRQVIVPLK